MLIIFFTIFGTIAVGNLGIKALIKSCIPVISRYYWFISCYFFLCFLTPFLNQIPEKLSKENFEKLLAVLLLLFSVIPTFGFFEIMQDGGKGLVHMVMIYLLGRYLALYHNRSHNTGRLFLGLFLSIGFIFLADSSLTFVRGKLYTTFCRDCSILWIEIFVGGIPACGYFCVRGCNISVLGGNFVERNRTIGLFYCSLSCGKNIGWRHHACY